MRETPLIGARKLKFEVRGLDVFGREEQDDVRQCGNYPILELIIYKYADL